jgi:RNA polymerase sigma-54 factor
MRIKATTQLAQKQILAPYIQQSIEVLLLPLMDLNLSIEQELQNNPLLETEENKAQETLDSQQDEELIKKISDYQSTANVNYLDHTFDDDIPDEKPIQKVKSLEENLIEQLHVEMSDPFDILIGEFIIGNLNEDGYLHCSMQEIADQTHASIDRIESILKTIQFFDPIGIASRNLKECLLVQITDKDCPHKDLVQRLIKHHLTELGQKKFAQISKKIKVSLDDIKQALKIISSLEPKPARNCRPLSMNTYITPDVFIVKTKNNFQVTMNDNGYPALRINTHYKKLLTQNHLTPEEKEFIRNKLKQAVNFIRSIEQRGKTIHKIAEYILDKQKHFFSNEDSNDISPMNLKDVALAIDRNESTVSRAINNKFISTPKGILPLKYFFSKKVSEASEKAVSSRSIKEEIKMLVKEENPSTPLSDQEIQNIFLQKGLHIARRTVSKYRQCLNILPSHLRKK